MKKGTNWIGRARRQIYGTISTLARTGRSEKEAGSSTMSLHEGGARGGEDVAVAAVILIAATRGAVARRATVLRRRGATPRSFSRFSRGKPCRRLLLVEVSTRSALFVRELNVQHVSRSRNNAIERITEYSEI